MSRCNLSGMVVVVTGGAGWLGKEFVKVVVENEGICVVADVDEKASKEVSRELKSDKIECVTLDITSEESIEKMIKFLEDKYGRIDALVNNAYPRNKNFGRNFEDVSYGDFCDNVGLHLGGYFLVSQKVSQFFKKQGNGNIVNIASIYGCIPPRFEIYEATNFTMPVEYAVIKSAVIHLTKYMAKYFKGMNIRCNCISPGGILRGQPQEFLEKYNVHGMSKGMLDGHDVTGTLLYLLSDMSIYVNGQNMVIDDGWTL